MRFLEILEKKRDRASLSREEIHFFVNSYTNNAIPDYQASALLMAMFLNKMSVEETAWLTEAMLNSGIVVDLSEIPGTKVDKHSTGGVGDKTSLLVAPICAALDIPVPMISGRGLGHTGGTLDKLESIPGFSVNLELGEYKKLVAGIGVCMIGQTAEIAPADKKLYALRDVTCTVESKSLISASIMSKKLAEGIDALVLDVKTGNGAFMKSQEEAEELAALMISIGGKMGKKVLALITDMNQPLGSHVGNALEIMESVELLKGNCLPEQRDLLELSILLAAHMIVLSGKTNDIDHARELALSTIKDLSAFRKFKRLVEKQNGDPESVEDFSKLPTATKCHYLKAQKSGYLKTLNALSIGKGALLLGAGRKTMESVIDPAVGVILRKKIGDKISRNDIIMEVKYNDESLLKDALTCFSDSFSVQKEKTVKPDLVKNILR